MPLKATLLKWLKLFGGDIRRAIVGYIVVGLILAGGSVVTFAKTSRDWLIQTLSTPLPLWVAIGVGLLSCLCTYLIAQRIHSTKDPLHFSLETIPVKPINLPNEQLDILILLFKPQHQKGLTDQDISKILKFDIQTTKYHLEELEKQKMIYAHWRPPRLWLIQQPGRKYLIDKKLISQQGVQVDG